jgi:hypothetical protein
MINSAIIIHYAIINQPVQYIQVDLDLGLPEKKTNNCDGCTCVKCQQFFEFAEPNQDDGTLVCWACRHGY